MRQEAQDSLSAQQEINRRRQAAFYKGNQWTAEQFVQFASHEQLKEAYVQGANVAHLWMARAFLFRKYSIAFAIACAGLCVVGMVGSGMLQHEINVNNDLAAQVRALKGE